MLAVGPSSAPQIPLHGDTTVEDLRGPMDVIREQRGAGTRIAILRLPDLESARNDIAVVSVTVSGRNSIASRVSIEKSNLHGM